MDLLWNHLQALGSDHSIFELAESWSCLMSIMLFSHLVWSLPPPSLSPRRSLFTLYYSPRNRCAFASSMWITLWVLVAAVYHCTYCRLAIILVGWVSCWFWISIPVRLILRLVLELINSKSLPKDVYPGSNYTCICNNNYNNNIFLANLYFFNNCILTNVFFIMFSSIYTK